MALDTLSKAIGDTIDLSVGDIVAKFGGDKRAIALAAQKGEIDPTKAVMAGMAVDRVVASAAQPQNTTVAEDALPGGLMAAQGFTDPTAQQQAPTMGQPQAPQRPGQGLNQVPVPQRGFAGGGIVGFQAGGSSASLITALERVLAKAKQSDPNLNIDYVRRSVLSAPPEQQQQLVQSLIERVALDQTPAAAPPSFTQALSQREVDPRVMGAMQAAGERRRGLTADEMAVPSPLGGDARQADTGAQYGARPIPGSQILAQKADAAGNIYAGGFNPIAGLGAIYEDAKGLARRGIQGINRFVEGLPQEPKNAAGEYDLPASMMDVEGMGFDPTELGREAIPQMPVKEVIAGRPAAKPPAKETPKAEPKAPAQEKRTGLTEDQSMALIAAGLGIMGGESPYALTNIGQGAMQGIAQYERGKKRRLAEEELDISRGLLKAKLDEIARKGGMDSGDYAGLAKEVYKKIDADMIRGQVAKANGLDEVPAPGQNKKFDAMVEGAINSRFEEEMSRLLSIIPGTRRATTGASAAPAQTFEGYSVTGSRPAQ